MPETASTKANSKDAVYSLVLSALVKANYDVATANNQARFAQDTYNSIQSNPNLQRAIRAYKAYSFAKDATDGTKKMSQANTLMNNAREMGFSIDSFKSARASGFATVFSASVDLFEALAKKNGLELMNVPFQSAKYFWMSRKPARGL